MDNSPQSLKKLFLLDPSVTFLNHGSFGATPLPVFQKYQEIQRELEFQPVEFLGRRAATLLQDARLKLAELLGTHANNLVYVTNATTGLNIIARSLNLGPSDEVLTSDHEYGALDRTWRFLSQRQGFKYINHPVRTPVTTTQAFVDSFWQGVTENTKVIFISHITSPTAIIFPVDMICKRARQEGILTIIDGAHVPGQIDLKLDVLDADFYSGNLHKWLCAPKGSAFLYAHPRVQHLVEPLIVSWGWHSDVPSDSIFIDEQEWVGTRDLSPFLAVPSAIQFQEEYHWDQVRDRCHSLVVETQKKISELTGLAPLHPDQSNWYAQLGGSPLPPEVDILQLKTNLYNRYRIEIPLIRWNNMNLIRFSFQGYNTHEEIDILIHALSDLMYHST